MLAGCAGNPSGGPRERVRAFGDCTVPPGTIQIHDQLDGDRHDWQYFAKIVMPPSRFEGFLESCGLVVGDLRLGHDHAHVFPRDAEGVKRRWWVLPDANAVAGMSGRYRQVMVVERDTDVAAFIVAMRPSP